MDFSLMGLMDEDACSNRLMGALPPDGLSYFRCGSGRLGIQRKHRVPVLDDRGCNCRRVFNAFTGTGLQKSTAALRPWCSPSAASPRASRRPNRPASWIATG